MEDVNDAASSGGCDAVPSADPSTADTPEKKHTTRAAGHDAALPSPHAGTDTD